MADFLSSLLLGEHLPPGRYGAEEGQAPIFLRSVARAVCLVASGKAPDAIRQKAQNFGVTLDDAPSLSRAKKADFIGIGPGRWLALGEGENFVDELEQNFEPAASVFDQSGGAVVLEASGEKIDAVLAKLVLIDLDPRVFGENGAATTSLAHVNLTLWRESATCWRFVVGRSTLAAFLRIFACAAAEYGLDWAG